MNTTEDIIKSNRNLRKKLKKSEKELKQLRKIIYKMANYKTPPYETDFDTLISLKMYAEKAVKIIEKDK